MSVTEPGMRGCFPKTHWLALYPFVLCIWFLVDVHSCSNISKSASPTVSVSATTFLTIAFKIPPCRSTLPMAAGVSKGANSMLHPWLDNILVTAPRLCNPRSMMHACGQPAHAIHLVIRAFAQASEVGCPPPCLTTSHM